MNLFTILSADAASATAGTAGFSIIWMLILLVAFYFILIRPQRKKEKKDAEMRKNIQLGDEVIVAGGIVGIVCKIEDETLVIETGNDRSHIRVARWSVAQNLDAEREAKAATAASAPAKKESKKNKEEKEIEKD